MRDALSEHVLRQNRKHATDSTGSEYHFFLNAVDLRQQSKMADVFQFPDPPPPPPPKQTLRATLFCVVGPSGRPLTCAAYDVETRARAAVVVRR